MCCLLRWFESNPQAAYTWASTGYPDFLTDARFFRLAAKGSPQLGLSALSSYSAKGTANHRLVFYNSWARADAATFETYAASLSDPTEKSNAEAILAWQCGSSDLRTALNWALAESTPKRSQFFRISQAVAGALSVKSPSEVAAIVDLAGSTGKNMSGAWLALASATADANPALASDHLLRIDLGDQMLGGASVSTLLTIQKKRPDLAIESFAQMHAGVRITMVEQAVTAWAVDDSAAAKAFLQGTPVLTENEKSRITAKVWPRTKS